MNIISPDYDGIDHINIYSKGKTELGRMLSNFYRCPIETEDGNFQSVEAYWYWLSLPNIEEKEQLRGIWGYQAKQLGKDLTKNFGNIRIDNFENKILKATQTKCLINYQLFNCSINTLPFEHYYNYGGKIVDVKEKYIWLIDGIDKIRNYIVSRL